MWRRYLAVGLFLALVIVVPVGVTAQVWTVLAFDPRSDGRDPALADAAQLSYRYDEEQDVLWFRVSLYGKPNEDAFGVNIVVDTGADDSAKMNWWGANKDFKFDKLITAWVTRNNGSYQGTVGVGDAAGARAGKFNNLLQNNLQIRVEGDSIFLGLKRTDLTATMKMNLIAAVGSNQQWNDDIPNMRSVTLDLSAPRPVRGLREIDVSRNNLRFPSDYKPLADNQPPLITRKGRGRQTLILIPGVYSGNTAFDGFIARNQAQYKFYLVTPPGLNGSPARPLPSETTSYGEFTWTRRLERDILDLISREKLNKPVIVAHGFPGSLIAHDLAIRHPEALGGVIDIAVMPVQFFPSLKDPSRKTPATPDERVKVVDESWVDKWFKYVTPQTWETNNYPAAMFSNDLDRAEQVRQQSEAAPLPVKVRYLAEFMASDDTSQLSNLNVRLLALRPGFNEKVLADPANSWYKASFQDSWDAFAKNSRIQLLTIPKARALILDDQPKMTDDAIAAFVGHISKPPKRTLLLAPENLRMGISGQSRYRQPAATDETFPFLEIMVALTLLVIAVDT
jgi:pimeloyl-ACP methyl ester carboxylesterase